jgi:hypothetical protein
MLRISSALHTIEEKWRSKRDAAGVHSRTERSARNCVFNGYVSLGVYRAF